MGKPKVTAVCVDLETTGLNYDEDVILEVGMVAFENDFDVVDTFQAVVCGPTERFRLHEIDAAARRGDTEAQYVVDMHRSNGLWDAVEQGKGVSKEEAEAQACAWLDKLGATGLPMMGSTVHFDRQMLERNMPDLIGKFHYRNIDVSSIREWFYLVASDQHLSDLSLLEADGAKPRKLHRSVSDCIDSRDLLMRLTEVLHR